MIRRFWLYLILISTIIHFLQLHDSLIVNVLRCMGIIWFDFFITKCPKVARFLSFCVTGIPWASRRSIIIITLILPGVNPNDSYREGANLTFLVFLSLKSKEKQMLCLKIFYIIILIRYNILYSLFEFMQKNEFIIIGNILFFKPGQISPYPLGFVWIFA